MNCKNSLSRKSIDMPTSLSILCKTVKFEILMIKTLYLSLSVTVDYLQLLSPSVDLTTFGCCSRHLDFRATTHSCLGQCLIRTEVGVYRAGAWGMHSSLCTLGGTCIKSGDTCDLRLYLRRRNTGTVVMEEHSRDCQIQNVSWGGWDGTGAAGDT